MFRADLRFSPSASSTSRELLLAALKACGILKELETGKRLHADAVKLSELCISNVLITMYAKCGDMGRARSSFETMSHRDIVSWNSLILGYVTNEQVNLALHCFERLQAEQREDLLPNSRTFVAALVSCSTLASKEQGKLVDGRLVKMNTLEKGRLIHTQATRAGYETDVYLSNALVSMYGSCGSLVDARSVFDKMVTRTVVSWNSIIHACVENGEPELALELLQRMKHGDCHPNARTFVAGIRACAALALREGGEVNEEQKLIKVRALERGKELHREAEENGLERELYVGNSLIDLYGKCGSLEDAKLVFQAMPHKDVISWNLLLQAYADTGDEHELERALYLFDSMQAEGLSLNSRTLVAVLMVCANLAVRNKARKSFCHRRGLEIHWLAVSSGFDSDLYVASTTIDMFSKCGHMSDARKVFDGMVNRDLVSWNALITGYVENEQHEFSLEAYVRMRQEGGDPDSLTLVSVLTSCSHLLELETGKCVHADVNRYGFLTDVQVTNCLLDLYGKCGRMTEAVELFESLIHRDLVTWSSLMEGFSRQGRSDEVLELFSKMESECFKPDAITFSAVLTACSHAGLVDRGLEYFNAMSPRYGVEPDMDNFHCMVDLLGRANRLEEAVRLVKSMPYEPNVVTWTTVLSACRKWKDVKMGEVAFGSLLKLEAGNSGAYSLMAEIQSTSVY